MAEKITIIREKEFSKGYFIEIECCMCRHEEKIGSATKKELREALKDKGWRNLDSDKYAVIGWWCGCDYID